MDRCASRSHGAILAIALSFLAACTDDEPPTEHVGAADVPLRQVCGTSPTRLHGIDVSRWQGTIDWAKVATAGLDFAFVRTSAGASYLDPNFPANWAGAKSAGLVRGAYHYFHPDADGAAQADLMLDAIGTLAPDDLSPVVDVEDMRSQTAATVVAEVKAFVDRVRVRTGRTAMIYTGGYFWDTNVKSSAFASLPLWTPHYFTDRTENHCPNTANAWARWSFWQYSEQGTIAGIGAKVDLDVFDGTRAELLALAGAPTYGAKYVAQSFPLASRGSLEVPRGGTVTVWIELENTGTATWDEHTALALVAPRDRDLPELRASTWATPTRPVAVKGTVPPGGTYRFEFVLAGNVPGTYDVFFNLVQDGAVWFSDPGELGPSDHQLEGIFYVPNATGDVDGGTAPADGSAAQADGSATQADGSTAQVDGSFGPGRVSGADGGIGLDAHRAAACSTGRGPTTAMPAGFAAVALLALAVRRRRAARGADAVDAAR